MLLLYDNVFAVDFFDFNPAAVMFLFPRPPRLFVLNNTNHAITVSYTVS